MSSDIDWAENRLSLLYSATKDYKLAIGFTDLEIIKNNFQEGGLFVNILNAAYGTGIQHWILVFIEVDTDGSERIACGFELDVDANGTITANIRLELQTKYGLFYLDKVARRESPYMYYLQKIKGHRMIGTKYSSRENNCQKFVKILFEDCLDLMKLPSTSTDWYSYAASSKLDASTKIRLSRFENL